MVKIKTGVNCLELNILWGSAKETHRTHSPQTLLTYEACITTKKYRHNTKGKGIALTPSGNIQVIILITIITLLTYILNVNIDSISGTVFP